jgi:hypothetical protein
MQDIDNVPPPLLSFQCLQIVVGIAVFDLNKNNIRILQMRDIWHIGSATIPRPSCRPADRTRHSVACATIDRGAAVGRDARASAVLRSRRTDPTRTRRCSEAGAVRSPADSDRTRCIASDHRTRRSRSRDLLVQEDIHVACISSTTWLIKIWTNTFIYPSAKCEKCKMKIRGVHFSCFFQIK